MGDTGCGPTAMAMVTSSLTGEEVTPTEMASLASVTGMRDETGTNANFIDIAANTYGLHSNESMIPDSNAIYESAKNGPTVLLGQNDSGTRNPFTDAGHYVVTDGVDSHGMINIKDPRGKGYNKKFKASDLANTTSSMWDFGGSGKNNKTNRNLSRTKIANNRKRRKRVRGGSGKKENMDRWMSIVKTVKKLEAATGTDYSNYTTVDVTIGKKTVAIRPDCSGYVFGCLNFYDVYEGMGNTSTLGSIESFKKASGFTYKPFTSWSDCQEGDIVGDPSIHTEIFSHLDKNGTPYVYNGGYPQEVEPIAGNVTTTHTYIWTPGEPGSKAVKGTEAGSWSGSDDDDSSSSSSDSTSSFKNKTLGKITSWLSEFANRSIEGLISGNFDNDWESFWANLGNDSSDSDDSDDATLEGSNTKEKIWNYLISKDISKNGAAGIMGCWEQESNNEPNRLEGDYFDPDRAKEAIKSNEKLDDYTLNFLFPHYDSSGVAYNRTFYNQDTRDGHYYPGFGLAQWTGINGEKLMDYAKKRGTNWWDLKTQLDFFWQTLSDNPSLKAAVDETSKASSPEDAATVFLAKYESGGSYTESQNSPRRASAKKIYGEFGGSGRGRISINKSTHGGSGNRSFNIGGRGAESSKSYEPIKISQADKNFLDTYHDDPRGPDGTIKASYLDIKNYERSKQRVEEILHVNHNEGGRGDASVDNVDILRKPKPPQTINNSRINNRNVNTSDMSRVMNTIVELLESIAGNTNNTVNKLDYLRSTVKNANFVVGGNTTNVINQGSSNTRTVSTGGSGVSTSKSRNQILAEKIARGV